MRTMKYACLLLLIFILSGCGSSPVKDVVEEDLKLLSEGNIDDWNALLFGSVDTAASEEWTANAEAEGNGFLADLLAMSSAKVKSVEETEIILEVTAPDMSDFFTANGTRLAAITAEAEMNALILEHAAVADMISHEIGLTYTMEDEEIKVDYGSPAFVDAMTGGLVSAYTDLISQMMEELGE